MVSARYLGRQVGPRRHPSMENYLASSAVVVVVAAVVASYMGSSPFGPFRPSDPFHPFPYRHSPWDNPSVEDSPSSIDCWDKAAGRKKEHKRLKVGRKARFE